MLEALHMHKLWQWISRAAQPSRPKDRLRPAMLWSTPSWTAPARLETNGNQWKPHENHEIPRAQCLRRTKRAPCLAGPRCGMLWWVCRINTRSAAGLARGPVLVFLETCSSVRCCHICCPGVTHVCVLNLSVTSASLALYQHDQAWWRNCSSKIGQARRHQQN